DNSQDLLTFLSAQLKAGKCCVATLNLQLLGNDAWHHQFIYAIDLATQEVYCTNPLEKYPVATFKAFLCTPSILVVRAKDIELRRSIEGGDESIYERPLWKEMDVAGQVVRCLTDGGPVVIPAIYKGGISI